MKIVEIPIYMLHEAPWNPNTMTPEIRAKLRESILRHDILENLVVRLVGDGYEVISGTHRLGIYRELDIKTVPCVVVDLDEARAKLLAQTLNRTRGQDDLGLKAEVIRDVLASLPQEEVLALLPETATSLKALSSLGSQNIAAYLENWQQAQAARLHHCAFQLTRAQLEVVDEAFARVLPQAKQAKEDSPNVKGTALYLLCKWYLESEGPR